MQLRQMKKSDAEIATLRRAQDNQLTAVARHDEDRYLPSGSCAGRQVSSRLPSLNHRCSLPSTPVQPRLKGPCAWWRKSSAGVNLVRAWANSPESEAKLGRGIGSYAPKLTFVFRQPWQRRRRRKWKEWGRAKREMLGHKSPRNCGLRWCMALRWKCSVKSTGEQGRDRRKWEIM